MTKSLTVDSHMCLPIDEDSETHFSSSEPQEELSELDLLVIDTSLNISNKLCLSAKQIVTDSALKCDNVDEELSENMESLCYVLEDTQEAASDPSVQLAALLKNLKKMEHALNMTTQIFRNNEEKS